MSDVCAHAIYDRRARVAVLDWRALLAMYGVREVMEWNGTEWNGKEQNGTVWNGTERTGTERTGTERNGMENRTLTATWASALPPLATDGDATRRGRREIGALVLDTEVLFSLSFSFFLSFMFLLMLDTEICVSVMRRSGDFRVVHGEREDAKQ